MDAKVKNRLKRVANWVMNIYLALFGLFVLWVMANVFCFASFSTPTLSMAPTVIAGDYVLVNKLIMGPRLFNIFDALKGKQVGICRAPGFGRLKSGDVVVFNHPYATRWDSLQMDISLYYMKRCIAVPGDTLEIRRCRYWINGEQRDVGFARKQIDLAGFLDHNASKPDYVRSVVVTKAFPNDPAVGWTIRDFGPIILPKKGTVIGIDSISAIVYRNYIEWESGMKLTNDSSGVRLGGMPVDSYEFKKDYCFVAGDNAYNSQDSRYFGLLPVEFVVGKATHIWQSINADTGMRRWPRTFTKL